MQLQLGNFEIRRRQIPSKKKSRPLRMELSPEDECGNNKYTFHMTNEEDE